MTKYELIKTAEYHLGEAGLDGVRVEIYSDAEGSKFGYRMFLIWPGQKLGMTTSKAEFDLASAEDAERLADERVHSGKAQSPE